VVMVYAGYGYMLEKKEKVLQKKIALQIWEGPGLYSPCAKKHMCFVFFIVPSCPKCSHDKLSWSCFLCIFCYFPGFESIFEHLNHYFLHLFSVAPGGFWQLQAIQWLKKEKKNCMRYKWSSWGISSSAFMIKFAYSSSLPQRLSAGLKKLE
jgi:hypothetical protein